MIPVVSSNIGGYEYEPETERLTVMFRSGGTYIYSGVPQQVWDDFQAAGSKGEFFHDNIKDLYQFSRVS